MWPGADFSADFNKLAERAAADMAEGATLARVALRLAGQSGSGKSSQLLPMAVRHFELAGIKSVHIAVRNFVPYFPNLDELVARVGKDNMREATNAFALSLMFATIEKLGRMGAAMIIELALLEPLFEEAVIESLADYDLTLHAIACPRAVSDAFIAKREAETGRIVNKDSMEYFWREHDNGFATWATARADTPCVVWSPCSLVPIYEGTVAGGAEVSRARRLIACEPLPADELLAAKMEFITRRAEA
jgi:predicted ABC-type ATPase